MPPRIAIAMPHSTDREYSERAIPQYERAVSLAGGKSVRIPLDGSPADVRAIVETCDGVLLPGSKADVDPTRFHQEKSPYTAAADLRREDVDEFLLEHAYRRSKPVLGICYGLQSLNVFRKGSLVQHIPEFLRDATRAKVNHEAGRTVAVAHTVSIDPDSRLARILRDGVPGPVLADVGGIAAHADKHEGGGLSRACKGAGDRALAAGDHGWAVPVNSSHHQSADTIGEGLRIVARCPEDGIIEALEATAADHFVLAVQWHPERSLADDGYSRLVFRALIEAAG